MRVDHRGGDILVAEQFLHAADIIAILKQMRSKTMPKGMAARGFWDGGGSDCLFDCVLQVSFRDVMAAFLATAWVDRDFVGRESVLPDPFAGGFRVFTLQSMREIDGAATAGEILLVKFLDASEVGLERAQQTLGENSNSLPHPLAFADGDLSVAEIDVFDAESKAFEKAETASI